VYNHVDIHSLSVSNVVEESNVMNGMFVYYAVHELKSMTQYDTIFKYFENGTDRRVTSVAG
jgi:hypothetical protein